MLEELVNIALGTFGGCISFLAGNYFGHGWAPIQDRATTVFERTRIAIEETLSTVGTPLLLTALAYHAPQDDGTTPLAMGLIGALAGSLYGASKWKDQHLLSPQEEELLESYKVAAENAILQYDTRELQQLQERHEQFQKHVLCLKKSRSVPQAFETVDLYLRQFTYCYESLKKVQNSMDDQQTIQPVTVHKPGFTFYFFDSEKVYLQHVEQTGRNLLYAHVPEIVSKEKASPQIFIRTLARYDHTVVLVKGPPTVEVVQKLQRRAVEERARSS